MEPIIIGIQFERLVPGLVVVVAVVVGLLLSAMGRHIFGGASIETCLKTLQDGVDALLNREEE